MSDGFVTVAQCVEALPLGRFVWEAIFCCFLLWFLLGSINESTPFAISFVSAEWGSPEMSSVAMAAALALGNFLAILAGGWMADRWGRTAVIRPALVMTVICSILLQTVMSFPKALIGRFALGLASGSLMGVVMPTLSELLPARHRGYYLTIWCSGWPAGALCCLAVSCLRPGLSWQSFYSLLLVVAMITYICIRAELLPESPRWLYLAGHRDEGYNTLLDMYDREMLPLPWSDESIAITNAPPRNEVEPDTSGASSCAAPAKKGSMSNGSVTAWLAVAMFCISAAAQSTKLWLPAMFMGWTDVAVTITPSPDAGLIDAMRVGSMEQAPQGWLRSDLFDQAAAIHLATGPGAVSLMSFVRAPVLLAEPDYQTILMLAQGYAIQLLGCVLSAHISTWFARRYMIQWSVLIAAGFGFAGVVAAKHGALLLCGPLLGMQLAAQATALNFLQAFTCEYFPTSSRAKTVALVMFAGQFGVFTVPALGGFIVERASVTGALIFFSTLYLLAWLVCLRLPLPTTRERPLFDIEEPKNYKSTGRRKRDMVTYQTV